MTAQPFGRSSLSLERKVKQAGSMAGLATSIPLLSETGVRPFIPHLAWRPNEIKICHA